MRQQSTRSIPPGATSAGQNGVAVPTAVSAATSPGSPVPPETILRDAEGHVTIRAVRISEPLRIDGQLDESVYRTVTPLTDFIQTNPHPNDVATERTEAWIFYDNDTIYLGARCHDSQPEARWVANEMRRDNSNIVRNENVAVLFDTFHDRRNAFLFEVTPIGGIYDSWVTNERAPGNTDWNPVWNSKAGRFSGGWTAEMAIPFKSIRYKPGVDQVWGINIRRTVRWKNEESFVTRMPQNSGSVIFMVAQAATLVGLQVPPGSKNLEVKPYAIGSVKTDRRANPPTSNDVDRNAGFDVKYGLTQNLTSDFTYNTDFAQVEVDEQQVNLTRFTLFFPEKRDFFLEGQGVYDFGGTTSSASGGSSLTPLLFFSRRIGLNGSRPVPIDAGGRLTGKVGKFTLAALDVRAADDRASSTDATNFSVLRVKRDILRRSSIGALVTDRSVATIGHGASQTYGIDAAFGFFANLNMNTYVAKTGAPGVSTGNMSYRGDLNYNGDRYGVEIERLVVQNHFNPDVGFLRLTDFRRQFGSLRFSPRPRQSKRVRKYSYLMNYDYLGNGEGRLESRDANAQFGTEFQNGDRFNLAYGRSYELLEQPFAIVTGVKIPSGAYGFQDGTVTMAFGNQRRISGSLSAQYGSFYDGHRTTVGYSGGRIALSPRLSLEPGVSINRVVLPDGEFTTNLVSNRATFTVTPRMFFSGLFQYNSTNHSLSSNLRLRWEYQPGSELFVVYTDERETLVRGYPDLKNRAFVVKANRLLRF